jgi:hypothetical protein
LRLSRKEGCVPHYWISFATPENIRERLEEEDWAGAAAAIDSFLSENGLRPERVYFDRDARRALLFAESEDVVEELDAEEFIRVFTAEEEDSPEYGESA